MTVLEKYLAGINHGDAKEISGLFTEEGKFDDGARRTHGLPDLVAIGEERIQVLWAALFASYRMSARLIKLNENSMEYEVLIDGSTFPCIGAATLSKDGRIAEYTIRPL
ncbi:hypothetical protein [Caproiciproducens sp.]